MSPNPESQVNNTPVESPDPPRNNEPGILALLWRRMRESPQGRFCMYYLTILFYFSRAHRFVNISRAHHACRFDCLCARDRVARPRTSYDREHI